MFAAVSAGAQSVPPQQLYYNTTAWVGEEFVSKETVNAPSESWVEVRMTCYVGSNLPSCGQPEFFVTPGPGTKLPQLASWRDTNGMVEQVFGMQVPAAFAGDPTLYFPVLYEGITYTRVVEVSSGSSTP